MKQTDNAQLQEKVWRKVARVLNRYDMPRLVGLAIGARIVAKAIADDTTPEQTGVLAKAYAELLTDLLNSYQPGAFTHSRYRSSQPNRPNCTDQFLVSRAAPFRGAAHPVAKSAPQFRST